MNTIHGTTFARIITPVLRVVALVAALAASASPALAQRDAQREKLAARLDTGAVLALAPVLDAAQAQGLPLDPLVQKALEGASKRAPTDRIVLAVRRLSAQLSTARTALGAAASASELVAGASALQAGVRPEVLASLRAQRPQSALTVPLGVLAELIARGVPADTGAMAVAALVGSDVSDAQLVALRRDVERDIGVGAPPTTALITRASGLTSGDGFGASGITNRAGESTPQRTTTPPRRRP
jgi:hypothetical protein